jgi:glyoxylase-like metal-dependent hydrolase (beta-lactamase superfamily II)
MNARQLLGLLASGLAAQLATAQGLTTAAEQAEEIRTEQLADGLYVMYFAAGGGNIIASIGEQGVLIVDDQFQAMAPKYQARIRELGGENIDFALNTHWHADHTESNLVLGPQGTWIIAQGNSRDMMTRPQVVNTVVRVASYDPYPPAALPVATFEDSMSVHFNGERIDMLHFGPAHTTGDAAVIFREHNVVHMGDVYNNAGYPFIDVDNGGGIDGVIRFCEAVLMEIDADTTVVPGHGPAAGYEDLRDYVAMLQTVRERMSNLVAEGATLEQVIAARPTAEWDDAKGDPIRLLDRAYADLSR